MQVGMIEKADGWIDSVVFLVQGWVRGLLQLQMDGWIETELHYFIDPLCFLYHLPNYVNLWTCF